MNAVTSAELCTRSAATADGQIDAPSARAAVNARLIAGSGSGHHRPYTIFTVAADHGDPLWNAFVDAMLRAGHADERRSRFGDKPALFVGSREIAHLEAPGVIDLRITSAGWRQAKSRYGDDPAVHRESSRRDWIGVHLSSRADLSRLGDLLAIAMAANA